MEENLLTKQVLMSAIDGQKCPRHVSEAIALICIGQGCGCQKLFCLECFSLESKEHRLINKRSFCELVPDCWIPNQKMAAALMSQIDQIQESFSLRFDRLRDQVAKYIEKELQLGEEDSSTGVLKTFSDLASNKLWQTVLRYQKGGMPLEQLKARIINEEKARSDKLICMIHLLGESILKQFDSQIEKLDSLWKFQYFLEDVQRFNQAEKHESIMIECDDRVAKSCANTGVHYVYCTRKLSRMNPSCQFLIREMAEREGMIGCGVVNRVMAETHSFTDLVGTGKGGIMNCIPSQNCMSKQGIWSYLKEGQERHAYYKIEPGCIIKVSLDFDRKKLSFFVIEPWKLSEKSFLLAETPLETETHLDDLYPAVAFSRKNATVEILMN